MICKRPIGSIVLYVAAIIVTIIGVAYLVTNIMMFQKNVADYVAQGYAASEVTSQLLLRQLLPGIYEPIAVYGGIAFILLGVGMANQKLAKGLKMLEDLKAEGTESDAEALVVEASDAVGLEAGVLQSDELGSSDTDAGKL